jgi:hypothetical protein
MRTFLTFAASVLMTAFVNRSTNGRFWEVCYLESRVWEHRPAESGERSGLDSLNNPALRSLYGAVIPVF